MRSKSRFADEIKAHVCAVLLNDKVIELAFEAQLELDEATKQLQPLLTRRPPFQIQTLLHAASPDPRSTVGFMSALLDEFETLPDWQAGALREAALRAARRHGIDEQRADYLCGCWVLFGPSPFDPFASMQALGREATRERCAQVLGAFRANLMVG